MPLHKETPTPTHITLSPSPSISGGLGSRVDPDPWEDPKVKPPNRTIILVLGQS